MKKRVLLPVFAAFMIFAGANSYEAEAASVDQLTSSAYKYIGTPYVYGGTTSSGFDCSGFTRQVFNDLGISLSRTSGSQYGQGQAVAKSNLQAGDLIFFNTSGAGISHVGIYIGDQKFIHSQTGKGVSVTNINESYWAKRYIGAKRVTNFSTNEVAKAEVKNAQIDFSVYASRGEVAIQLAEALNLDTSDTNSPFSDIKPSAKYAGAATALSKIGVFSGDENGKFNPASPVTRAQLAKILVVAFDLQQQGEAPTFSDVPASHWSSDYVAILASTGITVGKGDGTFAANDNVTLTHLEAFINRAMQQ
ncbi:C40 family peptidase [Metasolibacillus sp. FSL H7-0170]|uniref:C40 family peptidase n=1 Tax=unclassified Metasolibacillus TaxID=2703679 RepID=UPI000791E32D|nr:peptidase [[Bacillus] sp. KCTC 13219]